MSEIPELDEVTEEVKPVAVSYLKSVKESFEEEYQVDYLGESDIAGGTLWDLTIHIDDRLLVVSFEVVDSLEYEGELLGYNVSVKAVYDDGEIVVQHTPHNYTDKVWTSDVNELVSRAEGIPTLTPETLEG